MGRGRAKAKQTKVARDLKYRTHETDFGALARELHGDSGGSGDSGGTDSPEVDDEYDDVDDYDKWADYAERTGRD
jgi:hypothetical protein